jgi:hypothetical protein
MRSSAGHPRGRIPQEDGPVYLGSNNGGILTDIPLVKLETFQATLLFRKLFSDANRGRYGDQLLRSPWSRSAAKGKPTTSSDCSCMGEKAVEAKVELARPEARSRNVQAYYTAGSAEESHVTWRLLSFEKAHGIRIQREAIVERAAATSMNAWSGDSEFGARRQGLQRRRQHESLRAVTSWPCATRSCHLTRPWTWEAIYAKSRPSGRS